MVYYQNSIKNYELGDCFNFLILYILIMHLIFLLDQFHENMVFISKYIFLLLIFTPHHKVFQTYYFLSKIREYKIH